MEKRLVVIVCLSLILFSANIGGISIYILDEAKNSTAAREMFDRRDVIVPTFNNELRTDKPPLHYFFMMAAYSVFGVSEFAARFFSALLGIALVIVTYLFTRRFVNGNVAFWSALALLSSIQFITQFHMAVPDPYLIFFFSCSIFLAYAYYKEKKMVWLYLCYTCIALATLSKGPVAIVLAGGIWMFFLISQKDLKWSTINSFKPIQGIIIILILTLPWYILVHIQTNGAWTEGFFLKHNVGRFMSKMEGHGGSFLLIPLYVIMGLFPFSIFIIQAFILFWRQHRQNSFLMLSAIVSLVVILFFCFSRTKLPNYPAPAFPFVAIILGSFLAEINLEKKFRIAWSYVFYLLSAISLPVAIYIVLEDVMLLPELKNLAFWFILIPVGAIASLSLMLRNKSEQGYYALAASWIVTTLFFYHAVFPAIDKRNPVYQALQVIPVNNASVYYMDKYNPAFSFYIQKPIPQIANPLTQLPEQSEAYVLVMKKHLSDVDSLTTKYEIAYKNREFFEPYYSIVLHRNTNALTLEKNYHNP